MLRRSDEYPQSIIIENSPMHLEIFVNKIFPMAQPKLRKMLIMMQVNEYADEMEGIIKWLLDRLHEDLIFYRIHSYKREFTQLEKNIEIIKNHYQFR